MDGPYFSTLFVIFSGNIALHYAAKYCMKHPYPSNVRNLVTIPFLDSTTDYQELMKMPNNNGATPKLLLNALNKFSFFLYFLDSF